MKLSKGQLGIAHRRWLGVAVWLVLSSLSLWANRATGRVRTVLSLHPGSFSQSQVLVGEADLRMVIELQEAALWECVELDSDGDGALSSSELADGFRSVESYLTDHLQLYTPALELVSEKESDTRQLLNLQLLRLDRLPVSEGLRPEPWLSCELTAAFPVNADGTRSQPREFWLELDYFLEKNPDHTDFCQWSWDAQSPARSFMFGRDGKRWHLQAPELREAEIKTDFFDLSFQTFSRDWLLWGAWVAMALGAVGRRGRWWCALHFMLTLLIGLVSRWPAAGRVAESLADESMATDWDSRLTHWASKLTWLDNLPSGAYAFSQLSCALIPAYLGLLLAFGFSSDRPGARNQTAGAKVMRCLEALVFGLCFGLAWGFALAGSVAVEVEREGVVSGLWQSYLSFAGLALLALVAVELFQTWRSGSISMESGRDPSQAPALLARLVGATVACAGLLAFVQRTGWWG